MTEGSDFRDWSSGKRLFRLRAAGVPLSDDSIARLINILERHPDWEFDASEQAEFSIWSSSSVGERGDANALKGLPPEEILMEARAKAQSDRFSYSGLWRNFTQESPGMAFEALKARALEGDMDSDEWQQLFFKLREETSNRELDALVLKFLDNIELKDLNESFESIVEWLKSKRRSLESLSEGWLRILKLWDRIAQSLVASESTKESDIPDDIIMAVLNSTSGALVELLVEKLVDSKLGHRSGIPVTIANRLELAIGWPQTDGLIAQCALLQRLPWFEHIAPEWSWAHLVPLLQADSPQSHSRWDARFYHPSLGSQRLFEDTKDAFLATFQRFDRNRGGGGQALLLVRAAYKATRRGQSWNFSSSEARETVAHGGPALMREITRILGNRVETDSAESHWKNVVRPILDFIWPRTASLQTKSTSQGIIRLMIGAGAAFPKAVEDFLQFVRPWDSERPWDFDYLFDDRALVLLERHSVHAIKLLDAHVGDGAVPIKLNEILDRLEEADPTVAKQDKFVSLRGLARRSVA